MDIVKNVTIDGENFTLQPLLGTTVMKLNNTIAVLLAPLLASIEGFEFDLDKELNLDFDKIVKSFTTAVIGLDGDKFISFVVGMCSTTLYQPEGEPHLQMNKNIIDNKFRGKTIIIYKLLWEIMRYNKMLPFGIWGDGGLTGLTSIFQTAKRSRKPGGDKLEKSEK